MGVKMRGRWTAGLVAGMLLLGACMQEAATDAPEETPEVDAAGAPEQPPSFGGESGTDDPVASEDVDPRISLESATFGDFVVRWHDRLDVDPNVPLRSILADLRDPERDATLGPLTVWDRIDRIDGVCPVELRRIVGLDLGEDGSPRIGEALRLVADEAMVDATWITELADRPCSWTGRPYAYQEVTEQRCAIPDGRPYRCLTFTTHVKNSGPDIRHVTVDVRSGKAVSLGEVVAQVGGGGEYARRQVAELLCARIGTTDAYEPLDEGDPCPPLPERMGVVPADDGLTVIAYDLLFPGTRDVLRIPWDVVGYVGSVPLYEPPRAEDVTVPTPRPRPETVDVRETPEPWMARLGVSRLIPMERIPASVADPALPDGLGPLRVTAEVQRDRRYCAAELRHIVGLDLGPGAAAARMAADLDTVAEEFHAGAQWITTYDEEWCIRYGDRRPWSYQEVTEEPCELPGGPDVRCFTLTQWAYHEGEGGAPFDLDQPVYDVTTGARLDVADVLTTGAGTDDLDAVLARIAEALCSPELEGRIRIGRECTAVPITRAHPTTGGVWIGLTGRDDLWDTSTRYSEFFVPWEELRGGAM